MIRIAVCDDEPFFQDNILELIKNSPKSIEYSTDCFDNGDSLIKAHTKTPYDIIFLDIVMPLFNGLEAAKEIREQDKNVKIVFLTTSTDYAVESYTVKATNYLLNRWMKTSFIGALANCLRNFPKKPRVFLSNLSAPHTMCC